MPKPIHVSSNASVSSGLAWRPSALSTGTTPSLAHLRPPDPAVRVAAMA
jgi:hypothetical protein